MWNILFPEMKQIQEKWHHHCRERGDESKKRHLDFERDAELGEG